MQGVRLSLSPSFPRLGSLPPLAAPADWSASFSAGASTVGKSEQSHQLFRFHQHQHQRGPRSSWNPSDNRIASSPPTTIMASRMSSSASSRLMAMRGVQGSLSSSSSSSNGQGSGNIVYPAHLTLSRPSFALRRYQSSSSSRSTSAPAATSTSAAAGPSSDAKRKIRAIQAERESFRTAQQGGALAGGQQKRNITGGTGAVRAQIDSG